MEINAEQLRELIAGMTNLANSFAHLQQQAVASATRPPGVEERGHKHRKIQMRDIKVGTFEGGAMKWEEWSFQALNAVAATHKELYDLMKEAEKRSEEIDEDLHFDAAKAEVSAELYYMLTQLCSGEALAVVRSVGNAPTDH